MKIIGSTVSPFTRMVRIVCEELVLDYDFETVPSFMNLREEDDAELRSYNPLLKIPILLDGEQTIIESRLIIEYLLAQYAGQTDKADSFQLDANKTLLLSTIYGVIDAGILNFMLQKSYPEIDSGRGYIERSTKRIAYGLEWINNNASLGVTFGVPEIVLVSGLDWMKRREIYNFAALEHVMKVYDQCLKRPSFDKTKIPDNMP